MTPPSHLDLSAQVPLSYHRVSHGITNSLLFTPPTSPSFPPLNRVYHVKRCRHQFGLGAILPFTGYCRSVEEHQTSSQEPSNLPSVKSPGSPFHCIPTHYFNFARHCEPTPRSHAANQHHRLSNTTQLQPQSNSVDRNIEGTVRLSVLLTCSLSCPGQQAEIPDQRQVPQPTQHTNITTFFTIDIFKWYIFYSPQLGATRSSLTPYPSCPLKRPIHFTASYIIGEALCRGDQLRLSSSA